MKIRTVKEIQEELEAKRQKLHEIFTEAQTDEGLDMDQATIDDVRQRNEELTELGKELEDAKELDAMYQSNVNSIKQSRQPAKQLPFRSQPNPDPAQDPNGHQPAGQQPNGNGRVKSLGERVTESEEYKAWTPRNTLDVVFPEWDPKDLGRKTLMTTAAGFAPETTRIDRVIESAQRRPMVDDMIPQTTTEQAAVVFMEETTFTNAAAETAEGGSYPEGALAFTERSETVRKIATFIPVTDEQLEDVPQIQSVINNRLTLMIRLRRESQLLQGSGTGVNLTGFYNKTGIQTQAKGTDPVPDAVYKAMTKVRHTGFADPTAIILHPNDWQDVRLLRTTEGLYIWGNPSEAGPERMWGLPVVPTTAATENTGLTGDFQLYSEIYFKRGFMIKVSDSHGTYFIEGKQAMRADERLALVIYRAAAFCTVTGI